MSQFISIIMYHYVRELKHSRYPDIKGLDIDLFKEQIAYIKKHYNVISAYDLMGIIGVRSDLPPKALLLTFDDAYIDHFTQVFPILDEQKLPGLFFPPAKSILQHQVLDVNKIHFILASVPNKSDLVDDIYRYLNENRSSYELETNEYYWKNLGTQTRFDSAEVIFIKRILQRELPGSLRKIITDSLFRKYVTNDEVAFSQELYMSIDQISHLQRNAMYVGSHGFDHYWLDSISENDQTNEIDLSLQFLESIGSNTEHWIMCYPYGAYNTSLLNLLENRGCVVGLTTNVGIADLEKDNLLVLPRLDTNDLPINSNELPNEWTIKAMGG